MLIDSIDDWTILNILTYWLGFCPSVHTQLESMASKKGEQVPWLRWCLFQRLIKPSWLRMCVMFFQVQLNLWHPIGTETLPISQCLGVPRCWSCHRLTNLLQQLGHLYLCSEKTSSSQLTAVQDFRHFSVFQSFGLFVQIWRSPSLSHPQLQFCGRTCHCSRRFCFVTLLPRVGPISDIFGRRCKSLQYLQLTIWNACLATPVTPASLRYHRASQLLKLITSKNARKNTVKTANFGNANTWYLC